MTFGSGAYIWATWIQGGIASNGSKALAQFLAGASFSPGAQLSRGIYDFGVWGLGAAFGLLGLMGHIGPWVASVFWAVKRVSGIWFFFVVAAWVQWGRDVSGCSMALGSGAWGLRLGGFCPGAWGHGGPWVRAGGSFSPGAQLLTIGFNIVVIK